MSTVTNAESSYYTANVNGKTEKGPCVAMTPYGIIGPERDSGQYRGCTGLVPRPSQTSSPRCEEKNNVKITSTSFLPIFLHGCETKSRSGLRLGLEMAFALLPQQG